MLSFIFALACEHQVDELHLTQILPVMFIFTPVCLVCIFVAYVSCIRVAAALSYGPSLSTPRIK